MEQLFLQARNYGKVNIFTADDGTYSCTIYFSTLKHITLEASSGYKHTDVKKALSAAIENAEKICQSVEEIKGRKLLK